MRRETAESVKLLESINYADSGLFGLSIDVFKIRLLISVVQTGGLQEFGFDPEGVFGDWLCFEFSGIKSLNLDLKRGEFGPPYLEDGQLSASDLSDFRSFTMKRIGKSGDTSKLGTYRELVDIHEVDIVLNYGSIKFSFCDLTVSDFTPENFDVCTPGLG